MAEDGLVNLVVMAKPPVAGVAKTRLAVDLGDKAALTIYESLLETALRSAEDIPFLARFVYTFGDDVFKAHLATRGFTVVADMGDYRLHEKVHHAFAESFCYHPHTVMIVADDYFMSSYILSQAIPQVLAHQVVVGPTVDGGLYLIGISSHQLDLVKALPFGKGNLCAELMRRAVRHQHIPHVLPRHIDIDSLAHLEKAKGMSQRKT